MVLKVEEVWVYFNSAPAKLSHSSSHSPNESHGKGPWHPFFLLGPFALVLEDFTTFFGRSNYLNEDFFLFFLLGEALGLGGCCGPFASILEYQNHILSDQMIQRKDEQFISLWENKHVRVFILNNWNMIS